jgi:hypothetical protein
LFPVSYCKNNQLIKIWIIRRLIYFFRRHTVWPYNCSIMTIVLFVRFNTYASTIILINYFIYFTDHSFTLNYKIYINNFSGWLSMHLILYYDLFSHQKSKILEVQLLVDKKKDYIVLLIYHFFFTFYRHGVCTVRLNISYANADHN